jgi:glycosyl transferase family 25
MKDVQVISLERSRDRRQAIRHNLEGLGIDFEFFNAIDGTQLSASIERLVDRDIAGKILGRPILNGEIGCALTHALLLKKFIEESALDYLVVLEDDVTCGKEFTEVLTALRARAKEISSLLLLTSGYLFYPRWRTARPLVGKFRFVESALLHFGTYGMFYSRSVAAGLLKDVFPVVVPADYLGRLYGAFRPQVLGVWPPVLHHPHFEHDPGMSLIGEERNLSTERKHSGHDRPVLQRAVDRGRIFLRQLR